MGFTRSPLPQNNGNLPLPFFGGNYPIVLLDNGERVNPIYALLLFMYCEQLQMVEQAGGYYIKSFRREIGVTQGDTLLSTIFNVLVDTVVCHWESLVAEQAARTASKTTVTRRSHGEENPGTGQQTTAGGGGACKSDSEGGVILCLRRTDGFHRPGVDPVYV